ncbi:MAG: hypothetical protein AAGA73_10575 [Pseudomonadota bacterium]
MDISSKSSQQDMILQETAARLIDAMGIDTAIYICRSNYWHGVLRLILERKNKPRSFDAFRESPDQHERLHSLPPSQPWHDVGDDLPRAA